MYLARDGSHALKQDVWNNDTVPSPHFNVEPGNNATSSEVGRDRRLGRHVHDHSDIQDDVDVHNHAQEGQAVLHSQIGESVALHRKIGRDQDHVHHNQFNSHWLDVLQREVGVWVDPKVLIVVRGVRHDAPNEQAELETPCAVDDSVSN